MKRLIAVLSALLFSTASLYAHEHSAPHGGTLVVLGEEFAHLELVLDPGAGTLTGYVLDGEAENAVRVGQEDIEIKINDTVRPGDGAEQSDDTLILKAVSNVLTGETAKDTSEFVVQSDKLKGVRNFEAVIEAIKIKGRAFRNIYFRFPEGNE